MTLTRRDRYAQLAQALDKPRRQMVREHLEGQRRAGEVVRTVVQHAGWQVYLDHIDAHLESLERRKAALTQRLTEGAELGEALAALKLELRGLNGEYAAYLRCKQMVPDMIAAGEKAAEGLAGLEAAT